VIQRQLKSTSLFQTTNPTRAVSDRTRVVFAIERRTDPPRNRTLHNSGSIRHLTTWILIFHWKTLELDISVNWLR